MFPNPFTPIFGGRPSFFFGRKDVLDRFDLAMVDAGSEDCALFITGTRGSGKTALLEQLSMRATSANRKVIDLGPDDTVAQLIHELGGRDEVSTTISPQASINVLGVGGGLSAGSTTKTSRYGREILQPLLIEACTKAPHGLAVTIDEIQKVPIDDVSALCNAFQMASRKGCDMVLAIAGLPYAHDKIIHHDGCTYLRRAPQVELGLFTWEETEDAIGDAFARIKRLSIRKDQVNALNEASYGHPYLLQLLGYYLVGHINKHVSGDSYTVSEEDVRTVTPLAVRAYEMRALKPLFDECTRTEQHYLQAMATCLDDERLAATSDVARALGKEQRQLSRARQRLIDNGIIASPVYGKVMFCIPYLSDFVKRPTSDSAVIEVARQRRV